jgi:hypothetical protein
MKLEDKAQLKLEIEHIFESGANEYRIYDMVLNVISKMHKNHNSLLFNNILENLDERELYLKSFKINKEIDSDDYLENTSRLHELLLVRVHIQQQLINNLEKL